MGSNCRKGPTLKTYTVQQGDCISSIAFEQGFIPDTIWNHPSNSQLKSLRKDPNILYPGDTVYIPDKEVKWEPRPTDAKHEFKKLGVPAMLRLQVFDGEKPRANQSYILVIDGKTLTGTTDGDGKLEQPIAPNAKGGKLTIGDDKCEYPLQLGRIDPIDQLSGVQARLNNLGYDCGSPDGNMSDRTRNALTDFQHRFQLPETGEADAETLNKLKILHDTVSDFPPPNSSNSSTGGKT